MHRRADIGADADDGWLDLPSPIDSGRTAEPDGRFRLALSDLIPGTASEVVLFNDSALREVVLEGAEHPVDRGDVQTHVTGDGVDVSGFRYVRFADGLVLFYHPDTDLRIEIGAPPA